MRLSQRCVFLAKCGKDDTKVQQNLGFTGSFFKHLLALYIQCPKPRPVDPAGVALESAPKRNNTVELLHRRFGKRDLCRILQTHLDVQCQVYPESYVSTIAEIFSYSEAGVKHLIQKQELGKVDALEDKLSIVLHTSRNGLALQRTHVRDDRVTLLKIPVLLICC